MKEEYPDGTVIDCDSFYDEALFKIYGVILNENSNRIDELYAKAAQELDAAKSTHDVTEAYYTKAMDFDALDKMCHKLMKI